MINLIPGKLYHVDYLFGFENASFTTRFFSMVESKPKLDGGIPIPYKDIVCLLCKETYYYKDFWKCLWKEKIGFILTWTQFIEIGPTGHTEPVVLSQ